MAVSSLPPPPGAADVVWIRDPAAYLDQHPGADWFVSTDCLSHEVGPQGQRQSILLDNFCVQKLNFRTKGHAAGPVYNL